MKKNPGRVVIGICLLFNITIAAQNKKFNIDKESAWVTINSPDYDNTTLDREAEDGYIDVAYEKQINLGQRSVFYRKTKKIISEAGVQNSSDISIGFDPSYEQLTFHTIRILRNKEWIDKLQREKIKVIQQETELDRHVYNQSLSAILVLEDVRKGDIIEYSYTLKGFNPVFKDRYADMYDVAFSIPVYNMYYKTIVPKGRKITIKNSQTNIQPAIKESATETVYEWKMSNTLPFHIQDNLPSWFDPYPMIMVSEYQSWKEVNDWAVSLFPKSVGISPALQKKINEIRSNNKGTEQKILASLRFVQDDIRYMGIEMGENSHKPFPPSKIIDQRFGDCKDKSYLLCTMLRAMDIEANPVLINTVYKKTIADWLPTPTAFDHVTVQISLDSKIFYFDPTVSFQRGNINYVSYPDYQLGLVIDEETRQFTEIPVQDKGFVSVKEIFTIPDMQGNAHLKVISHYSGSFADDVRSSFNNSSNYQLLSQYRNYYAAYFDKITSDSLDFEDDETTGTFTTFEYYTIREIWKIEGGIKKAGFEPYVINSLLRKPKETVRQMPFQIQFPAWYKEDIEINLPEEWNAKESSNEIACDQFSMNIDYSYTYKKFLLHYEYKSYKDNVSAEQTQSYLNKYESAKNALFYELTWNDNNNRTKRKSEWVYVDNSMNIAVAFIILILGSIGIIVFRKINSRH